MRIGVCDDLQEARELIAEKIKQLCPTETVTCYSSGTALLDEATLPDVLFLDIRMPKPDGMATAKQLRERDRNLILIFVTAFPEYVFEAFDVGAFHYLVKPFSEDKFAEVLSSARRQYREKAACAVFLKEPLSIGTHGQHITVNPDDIVYAEVFNRKITIHTMDSDIEYYGKMKELAARVGDGFFRPHRAYLINFAYVRKYDSTTISLQRGEALIAQQNYAEFVKSYLKYNQRRWPRMSRSD